MLKKIIASFITVSMLLVPIVGVYAEEAGNTSNLETESQTFESEKEYTSPEIVKQVQEHLNDSGFDCGMADGIAGQKTKKAIEAYQESNGLQVTGTITKELLEKMGIQNLSSSIVVELANTTLKLYKAINLSTYLTKSTEAIQDGTSHSKDKELIIKFLNENHTQYKEDNGLISFILTSEIEKSRLFCCSMSFNQFDNLESFTGATLWDDDISVAITDLTEEFGSPLVNEGDIWMWVNKEEHYAMGVQLGKGTLLISFSKWEDE